jgi:cytochrome bd ubiquinol oxidase subunit II
MSTAHTILPAVWFALLGFILLLYTMLDGFDLGVGILSFFIKDEDKRGILMGSLGTIWDANETWLVLFGGIIFGAFPVVYGIVLSALYLPLVCMLVGLIFRAVSFEFRVHSANKRRWSRFFAWGSLLAAVSQGLAFGGLLWGLDIVDGRFVGGIAAWLSPFSVIVTIGIVCGYALIGSTYVVMKTEGDLRRFGRRAAGICSLITVIVAVADTTLAAIKYPFLHAKWFVFPQALLTIVPFAICAGAFLWMLLGLRTGRDRSPFFSALVFAFFGYVALTVNYFPVIVPPHLTIYQTAAEPYTQRIMLYAVGIALPFLLAYNILQYWIFRGKVKTNLYEDEE